MCRAWVEREEGGARAVSTAWAGVRAWLGVREVVWLVARRVRAAGKSDDQRASKTQASDRQCTCVGGHLRWNLAGGGGVCCGVIVSVVSASEEAESKRRRERA